ncbi:MAG TPA: hypothetical protein VGW98_05940 [Solirubrobacteraceae bacterium]|jgi:hypothetical protein|nr:hypothetical protein [Solirubrobacteraceae bacterium]
MSKRNLELTRRWVEAFNARDVEAQIDYCDPSIRDLGVSEAELELIEP